MERAEKVKRLGRTSKFVVNLEGTHVFGKFMPCQSAWWIGTCKLCEADLVSIRPGNRPKGEWMDVAIFKNRAFVVTEPGYRTLRAFKTLKLAAAHFISKNFECPACKRWLQAEVTPN